MGLTEEAKCEEEMGSQIGRWISRTQHVEKVKGQKYFKNKRVLNGGSSNKIVGDLGEVNFRGVVGTETRMQWADEKVGYEESCILWLPA